MEHIKNIIKRKEFKMRVKLIKAIDREFKTQDEKTIKGKTLVFLNETAGETTKFFVSIENLKGFDPKQLSQVNGPELEISTTVKTFQGNTRIVLDQITEVQKQQMLV